MTRDASLVPVTLSRLSHDTLVEAWPLCIGGGTRHLPGSAGPNLPPWDSEPGVHTVPAGQQTVTGAAEERRAGARPGAATKPRE